MSKKGKCYKTSTAKVKKRKSFLKEKAKQIKFRKTKKVYA